MDEIEEKIVALATARGAGRTVDPAEVARALSGPRPEEWSRLMRAVRRAAVKLMKEGRIVILRKGRPVDPDDFRGIYRLARPGDRGPGSSSSE